MAKGPFSIYNQGVSGCRFGLASIGFVYTLFQSGPKSRSALLVRGYPLDPKQQGRHGL